MGGRRVIHILLALLASTLAAPMATAQTKARKTRPPVAPNTLALGERALRGKNPLKALQYGETAAKNDPKDWRAQRLIGDAATLLDRPDRAEKAYLSALKLAPSSARSALQRSVERSLELRKALAFVAEARAQRAAKDLAAAARAEEKAYRAFPERVAYGLQAARMYDDASLLFDAERLLLELRDRNLSTAKLAEVEARLAATQATIKANHEREDAEVARKEEAARKEAEAKRAEEERRQKDRVRRAKEAERQRQEDARKQEEERQRVEKERAYQAELSRLNGVLDSYKSDVANAESKLRHAQDAISQAESEVRRYESEVDDARSRRSRAKGEVDEWQSKIDNAKKEIEKEVYRGELRSAKNRYEEADNAYDRATGRRDAARSRLSQAQNEADAARRELDTARQNVRETEDAISRLNSGA